jgi:pimeloyl-ACP methyl ester carboxylesterase
MFPWRRATIGLALPSALLSSRRPFAKVSFASLPDEPRIPHAFARCRTRDLHLDSEPFGRIRVHVRTFGKGPPLLLVHGLMTSSYSFRYVFEPLGEHFTVIAPDLPGAGRTQAKPDRSHSAGALARFVGEVQSALGIRGCFALGNSLGGYVCLQRMLQDDGAFSRLMVVHAPAFPEPRIRLLNVALGVPGTEALLRWMIHRDPLKWAFENVHYRDETLKSLEEAREYGTPLSTIEGAGAFRRYLREAVEPGELGEFVRALRSRTEAGEAPKIPILLAYSRQDPMVPPSIGPRLAALLPDAKFVWMDDTSHFAHVDTPGAVVDLMLPFFAE